MADGDEFGRTADGRAVQRFAISGGGLSASLMNWGAVVIDLRLDGHDAPLVLGFEDFDDYLAHPSFFGAIVGRYANRIGGGRFNIAGQRGQADLNFLGKHMLHGGSDGFFRRIWDVALHGEDFVTLKTTAFASSIAH